MKDKAYWEEFDEIMALATKENIVGLSYKGNGVFVIEQGKFVIWTGYGGAKEYLKQIDLACNTVLKSFTIDNQSFDYFG